MQVTTAATAVSFLLSCCLLLVEPRRKRVRETSTILTVSNGKPRREWGPKQVCPSEFAEKFSLKVEPYQGETQDDTSVNGIRLYCSDGTIISSSVGWKGTWSEEQSCKSGFLNSFSLRVSDWDPFDNTAVDNIKFKCTDGTELEGNGLEWGTYGEWSESCKLGICGIQTNVAVEYGSTLDPIGLRDAKFFCCNYYLGLPPKRGPRNVTADS